MKKLLIVLFMTSFMSISANAFDTCTMLLVDGTGYIHGNYRVQGLNRVDACVTARYRCDSLILSGALRSFYGLACVEVGLNVFNNYRIGARYRGYIPRRYTPIRRHVRPVPPRYGHPVPRCNPRNRLCNGGRW